jgi:serine/threonine protein kinase
MPPDADATPPPGAILAGKYLIEKTLGQGGMGLVLGARHTQLDERVAIKCLLPEYVKDRDVVARFLQEGRAAIKIRSEHVVRIYDVGELESGAPYIVMEYLDGRDLDDLVEKDGPLPVSQAIDHVTQALEAIAEAHALGMVHRDLKPANLFLTQRVDGTPSIKVLDFGISKVQTDKPELALTKTSAVMGSPHFMSPEQMRSTRSVDARADIWAIGIILHHLISGKGPFQGESLPELFAQILQDSAPPLSSVRGGVPASLDRVVLRCLEKDPDRRYPNVAELAFALAEFGSPSARASAERIARVLQSRSGNAPIVEPVVQPQVRSPYAPPTGPNVGTSPPTYGQAMAPVSRPYMPGPAAPIPYGPGHTVQTPGYPTPVQRPTTSTTSPSTAEIGHAPQPSQPSYDSYPIPGTKKSSSAVLAIAGVIAGLVVVAVGVGAWKAGTSRSADATQMDAGATLATAPNASASASALAAKGATSSQVDPTPLPQADVEPLDPLATTKSNANSANPTTNSAPSHPSSIHATTTPSQNPIKIAPTSQPQTAATTRATSNTTSTPHSSAAPAYTYTPPTQAQPVATAAPSSPANNNNGDSQFHKSVNTIGRDIGQGFKSIFH